MYGVDGKGVKSVPNSSSQSPLLHAEHFLLRSRSNIQLMGPPRYVRDSSLGGSVKRNVLHTLKFWEQVSIGELRGKNRRYEMAPGNGENGNPQLMYVQCIYFAWITELGALGYLSTSLYTEVQLMMHAKSPGLPTVSFCGDFGGGNA